MAEYNGDRTEYLYFTLSNTNLKIVYNAINKI